MSKNEQRVLDYLCQRVSAKWWVGECYRGDPLGEVLVPVKDAKIPLLLLVLAKLAKHGLILVGYSDDGGTALYVWVLPQGWLAWSGWENDCWEEVRDSEAWQDWSLDDGIMARRPAWLEAE